MNTTRIGEVAKAIVSALGAGLTAGVTSMQDGHVDGLEGVGIAGAVLASGGLVWLVRNAPSGFGAYAKALVSLVTVALGAIGTALLDQQGITVNEWLTVALAAVTALTVSIAPNAAESDDRVLQEPFDGPEAGRAHFEGLA